MLYLKKKRMHDSECRRTAVVILTLCPETWCRKLKTQTLTFKLEDENVSSRIFNFFLHITSLTFYRQLQLSCYRAPSGP